MNYELFIVKFLVNMTITIKWGLFLNNDPLQNNYQLTGVEGEFLVNGDGSFDGIFFKFRGKVGVPNF